jgi:hypothetical protein
MIDDCRLKQEGRKQKAERGLAEDFRVIHIGIVYMMYDNHRGCLPAPSRPQPDHVVLAGSHPGEQFRLGGEAALTGHLHPIL